MTRSTLAALAVLSLGFAAPALADGMSYEDPSNYTIGRDGCPRLRTNQAMIIVIPQGGCGTAALAAARGDDVSVVYGIEPPPQALTAVTFEGGGQPVIVNNVAIGISVSKSSVRAGHGKVVRHGAVSRTAPYRPTVGKVSLNVPSSGKPGKFGGKGKPNH